MDNNKYKSRKYLKKIQTLIYAPPIDIMRRCDIQDGNHFVSLLFKTDASHVDARACPFANLLLIFI